MHSTVARESPFRPPKDERPDAQLRREDRRPAASFGARESAAGFPSWLPTLAASNRMLRKRQGSQGTPNIEDRCGGEEFMCLFHSGEGMMIDSLLNRLF